MADYSRHSALHDRLAGLMTFYFADVFRYQSLYSIQKRPRYLPRRLTGF